MVYHVQDVNKKKTQNKNVHDGDKKNIHNKHVHGGDKKNIHNKHIHDGNEKTRKLPCCAVHFSSVVSCNCHLLRM